MRPLARGAVTGVVAATVALGAVTWLDFVEVGLALDGYVLAIGAIALATTVRATRSATAGPGGEPALERALRRSEPTADRPSELARLERNVDLARGSAFYVHYRLRPLAREIAAHRLESSRGIDLDGQPAAARAVFSDEAWELVRPERPEPSDRHGTGLPLSRISGLVDELEAL